MRSVRFQCACARQPVRVTRWYQHTACAHAHTRAHTYFNKHVSHVLIIMTALTNLLKCTRVCVCECARVCIQSESHFTLAQAHTHTRAHKHTLAHPAENLHDVNTQVSIYSFSVVYMCVCHAIPYEQSIHSCAHAHNTRHYTWARHTRQTHTYTSVHKDY